MIMNSIRRGIGGLIAALCLCAPASATPAADPVPAKIGVMVSILPLAYFAEGVGKGMVEVSVMVPPGGNPHTYEPTPRQLDQLSRARVYVEAGSGLEFELVWMGKLAALNRKMKVCDASKGIALIGMEGRCGHGHDAHEHGEGGAGTHAERVLSPPSLKGEDTGGNDHGHGAHHGMDPHVWLSPANAAVIVKNIRELMYEYRFSHLWPPVYFLPMIYFRRSTLFLRISSSVDVGSLV
jgi:zinc transport system substrate-binding protein